MFSYAGRIMTQTASSDCLGKNACLPLEINSLGKIISSFHVSVSHMNLGMSECWRTWLVLNSCRLLCEVPAPKYVQDKLASLEGMG